MILQVLIAMIAGWINRHQQQVIAYLLEEKSHRPGTQVSRRHELVVTWSTKR